MVYRAKQSQLNRAKCRSKRVQEIVKEVSCVYFPFVPTSCPIVLIVILFNNLFFVGILQQQMERSQANRSESPHVPVTVLKDTLRQMNPE